MLFCTIISKRCKVGNLGSFPSLAVDSWASFMKSLPFSGFSVPYIGTACSASQSCWWMRCWSVWQSLNFLKDGRYKRAECDTTPQWQKSCCVNTLPEFSRDVPLFSFQAKEGGWQKPPGLWQSWKFWFTAWEEQDNLQYDWLICSVHIAPCVVMPELFADCKGTLDLV